MFMKFYDGENNEFIITDAVRLDMDNVQLFIDTAKNYVLNNMIEILKLKEIFLILVFMIV